MVTLVSRVCTSVVHSVLESVEESDSASFCWQPQSGNQEQTQRWGIENILHLLDFKSDKIVFSFTF